MKRAIIYARVSTDDQAEKGYSLPTQLEAMRKYAQDNGFKVVRELQDDYTGAKLDRPALDTLRGMLERREADAVIVYAADRLSRNLAHLLILREEFNRAGIELHYVNRGRSQDTAESRLLENVEGVIAEFEREKIRERTRRGKVAKAKAGKWVGTGRTPYGFRQVGKGADVRLEIDQAQAAIVRRIVNMFLGRNGYKPMSIRAISGQLFAEGITTHYGARGWWRDVLRNLLKGKELIGIFVRYGSVLEFPELAIIDRATWDEVQAALEQNKHRQASNRKYEYLFSGFVKCACGRTSFGACLQKYKTTHYRHYICRGYKGESRHLVHCNEKGINVDILDPLVWNWLTDLLSDDAKLEKGLREMVANRENELGRLRARRADTAKLIRQKDKQIDQLRADLRGLTSNSGRAAILKDIDFLGNEKDSLLAEQQAIDAELEGRAITDDDLETIREFARVIRRKLNGNPTYEEKRALFQMLNLEIQVRHNGNGREVKVTCALPNSEKTLSLPPRKNYEAVERTSSKSRRP